ncbi:MAG: acyltransferase family protein [Actinomycetota bacterium]
MTSGNLAVVGERSSPTMPYVPGIDGLRALAVIAIFVFHLGVGLFPGAVFSVTLFFTLSGYLVTSLVLVEFATSGRLDLRRFWVRRFRRLMPAALFSIAAVGVCGLLGVFEGSRLRGDLLWATGYASNWRSAAAPTGYSDLFTSETSPLLHFWSLAIEEQFYILFPLLAWLLLRNRRLMITVFSVITVASVVAAVLTSSRNLAYYGTHARVAELTVGVLFAFLFPVRKVWSTRASRRWSTAGSLALVVFIALLLTVHSTDDAVYKGALAAFAVIATLMIAAVSVDGPMKRVFSWRPVVELGRISYPAYLVHWPVIVALDEDRLGFDGVPLQLVRVAVTLVLAVGIARLVEDPVRTRRVLRSRSRSIATMVSALTATVLIAILVPSTAPMALAGLEAPEAVVDFESTQGSGSTPPTTPPPEVLVMGSQQRTYQQLSRAGLDVSLDDASRPGCVPRAESQGECPSLDELLSPFIDTPPAVIVIGVGAIERVVVRDSAAVLQSQSTEPPSSTVDPAVYEIDAAAALVEEMFSEFDDTPVIVVDYGPDDRLREALYDLDLRLDSMILIEGVAETNFESAFAQFLATVSDARSRVMVIGDSTSFGLAQALHDTASDRLDVVWAGGRNCPLVEVERIQWWSDVDFAMDYCPTFDDTWKTMIIDFRPDLVVFIASVPEQSGQRYPNDPDWHFIGDEEYSTRHERVFSHLMDLVDEVGATFVMFDAPYIRTGALSGAAFASDDRVDAWNALMNDWASRWPRIERIGWASIIDRYESAEGPLRVDGVHLSQANLDRIITEAVIPELTRMVSERGLSPTPTP